MIPVLISESKDGKLSRMEASFCFASVRSAAVPDDDDDDDRDGCCWWWCGCCCMGMWDVEYAGLCCKPPPPPAPPLATSAAVSVPEKGRGVAIADVGRRCCALRGVGVGGALPPVPLAVVVGGEWEEAGGCGGGGGRPVCRG